MAVIRHLTHAPLQIQVDHSEVAATYSWVQDMDGKRYLQIDTYGSSTRAMPGKKSQTIRFSQEALKELAAVMRTVEG
jgi:hypothetical protein